MTQLPPSLVWLVWVFLEFSLCSDEGFVSEGCTSECSWWSRGTADDNPDCTRCAVTFIYFFTSRAIEKQNKYGILCPSHKHLAIHILVIFYEWLLLIMPSEFQPHLRFSWCWNFPAVTEADFITIAALCWQTKLGSVLPDLHRSIWQKVFAKDPLCTSFVFWLKHFCAVMLCITFEMNFNRSIFNFPPL